MSVFLLGKLASENAPTNHGGWLPSRRLGSLHAESVASSRPPSRGEIKGIGPVDKVFYTMRFRRSIDDGGHRQRTTAVGPHSWLLSVQQSDNILCDRLVSLKLEKTIIIYVY